MKLLDGDEINMRKAFGEMHEKYISKQVTGTEDIEMILSEMKYCIKRSAKEVLLTSTKPGKNKEWFDYEGENVRREGNAERMRWIETRELQKRLKYERKRNKANAIYKRKNNTWMDEKLRNIERENQSLKQFYKSIKVQTHKSLIRTRAG